MLEAKVHSQLRDFSRFHREQEWIHQLTMGRMIARGLRLKSSTIIQTGVNHKYYYLSYLIPALLSPYAVVIVIEESSLLKFIFEECIFIQKYIDYHKKILNDYPKNKELELEKPTLYIVDTQTWLEKIVKDKAIDNLTTIIVKGENLIEIIYQYLTLTISYSQLLSMIENLDFSLQDLLREKLANLLQLIYSHPPNPYDSYLLEKQEKNLIKDILTYGKTDNKLLTDFLSSLFSQEKYIHYFIINRSQGSFSLKATPLELKSIMEEKWLEQNLIIIADYLEPEKIPLDYGNYLGLKLKDFTCLKFSPNPQGKILKIYFPDNFPFPNNPNFATKVNQEILALISGIKINHCPIIVIIDDVPLQGQITASLAANFGSRVKLKTTDLTLNSILVCDTDFLLTYQDALLSPQLVIMATLPLPSLENPIISAKVSYFKSQKKDWFRLYLLPIAIKNLQRITISLRQNQGVLALLDNRVNYRIYGGQILQALEPYGKINYLDLDWIN
ncbi:helicase C-terminal domain-containing protein [Cyanobacterium sp. DS4]|uniref:helicase C-terminal domain-containing protein n=1 Tax=Cyanobacterium sp. DS4 TaxID=2878255 RepID=UPI002E7FD363|nr:helicase C-terminal domain-containing protein [Cyanobacterium sp. Dongsha4]WVK99977.1 DNA helicase [Cyanobacterium sp. Dongsha4]